MVLDRREVSRSVLVLPSEILEAGSLLPACCLPQGVILQGAEVRVLRVLLAELQARAWVLRLQGMVRLPEERLRWKVLRVALVLPVMEQDPLPEQVLDLDLGLGTASAHRVAMPHRAGEAIRDLEQVLIPDPQE